MSKFLVLCFLKYKFRAERCIVRCQPNKEGPPTDLWLAEVMKCTIDVARRENTILSDSVSTWRVHPIIRNTHGIGR
jgi:hypothetical protein